MSGGGERFRFRHAAEKLNGAQLIHGATPLNDCDGAFEYYSQMSTDQVPVAVFFTRTVAASVQMRTPML
jgi:hypothetical protein